MLRETISLSSHSVDNAKDAIHDGQLRIEEISEKMQMVSEELEKEMEGSIKSYFERAFHCIESNVEDVCFRMNMLAISLAEHKIAMYGVNTESDMMAGGDKDE